MSERTLRRLLMATAALAVLWGITAVLGRGGGARFEEENAMRVFLDGLSRSRFAAVHLPGDRSQIITVEQVGGSWSVNGYPADSSSAELLWNELEGADVIALVASNPSNHERLGVHDDSALVVVFEGAGVNDTLLLGKSGPNFGTVYARLPGMDEVYHIDASIRPSSTRNLEGWRSKRIAALDTAAVAAIEVARGDDRYTLERTAEGWTVDRAPADSLAVRNLMGELWSLVASAFADPDEERGDPDRTLVARDGDGVTVLALSYWEGEGNGPARREGDETVYLLAAWRADRVIPDPETILPDPDPVG